MGFIEMIKDLANSVVAFMLIRPETFFEMGPYTPKSILKSARIKIGRVASNYWIELSNATTG